MIDKLEMLIALARERHFGRAAEACGVTQPTLSSGIRQLETTLGVQLVWRGARFRGLTPEGERTLEWALRIVADARSLRAEMRAARGGLSGLLRLGVIPSALPAAADLVAPFVERHPGMRVSILSRSSVEILHQIETLDLDAGITYLDNEPLGRVNALPLMGETHHLLVRAGALPAGTVSVGWDEVARLPLCLLTPDMQNRRIVEARMAAAGSVPAPRIESNSILALIGHVLAGPWATVLSGPVADLVARDPRLACLPVHSDAPAHSIGLVTPQHDPPTPVLAALMAIARRTGRA